MSEAQLLQGCLNGDRQSQKALYEQYKVQMYRLCLRYSNGRSDAEDVLQDGFIKVFSDLHQYSGKGALGGWIRKVMVNTALQHIRKNKRIPNMIEVDQIIDLREASEQIYSRMGAKDLTKMIQELPPGYKMIFNLYVVDGYTHQEIADQLNISINTSKSQLSKAKATLRKKLEKNDNRFLNRPRELSQG